MSLSAPSTEGTSNDAAEEELARFEGKWRFDSGKVDTRNVPPVDLKDASMAIHAGRATISEGKQALEVLELRVNPATQPKQVDTMRLSDPDKGATALGIYEVDGDTLRICPTWTGRTERPETFEVSEGSRLVLAVWKRGRGA